ncbi:MAG: PP2C family serine/threonine-protein phosphatase [Tetrasphaera sp.]
MTSHPAPSWEVISATARGASHVSNGLPNQDAHAIAALPDGTIVIAVADGHGGRGYVRSDAGSRMATEQATQVVTRLLSEGGTGWSALHDFPGSLVEAWREAVLAHLSANPLDELERTRATAETLAQPLQLYGATLLVAALGRDGLWAAQIGDGDIIVASGGACRSPVPGDDRLVGNATTSLCGPDATNDFRLGVLRGAAPGDLVLLATDGYGNSFAADDWAPEVLGDLAQAIERHGVAAVAAQLPAWTGQSAAVGGDDTTVVLASRRATPGRAVADPEAMATIVRITDADDDLDRTVPVANARVSAESPVLASEREGPTREPRARGRAAYGLVAAAAVLVAIGVFLGVRALSGSAPIVATHSNPVTPATSSVGSTAPVGDTSPQSGPPCLYLSQGESTPRAFDPTYTPMPTDPTYTVDPRPVESFPPGCVLSSGDNEGQTLLPNGAGS